MPENWAVPSFGLRHSSFFRHSSLVIRHWRLLLLLHRHHFPSLIMPAIGAHAVGQHRLVALGAVLHLHWLDVEVAPPFALPGMRRSSLRYGHRSFALLGNLGNGKS